MAFLDLPFADGSSQGYPEAWFLKISQTKYLENRIWVRAPPPHEVLGCKLLTSAFHWSLTAESTWQYAVNFQNCIQVRN